MHRAFLEQRLKLAQDHVVRGKEEVARQRRMLARPSGEDRHGEVAWRSLNTLEAVLALQEKDRDCLLRELAERQVDE
jgi:hypothetical protein